MPRYVYHCRECNGHFQVRHGMKESQKDCLLCKGSYLTRVPQMPIVNKTEESLQKEAGSVTKEFIESNRDLLKEMKKEARSQAYDD